MTFTPSHDSVTFSWHTPSHPNGDVGSYSIRVYTHEGQVKDMYFTLDTDEMQQKQFTRTVGDLKSETPYEIDVRQLFFFFFCIYFYVIIFILVCTE